MTSQKCKYCGEEKKLIRAHIIPRGLYPKLAPNVPLLIMAVDDPKDRRSPIGVYDTALLCADCDNIFGRYDKIAAETFLPEPTRGQLLKEPDGLIARGDRTKYAGYYIPNPDVHGLQLFCASLVWRAAHTSRHDASVKISHSFKMKADRLLRKKAKEDYFGVFASRFDNRRLSEFVTRPSKFSGDHGVGVTVSFSGFSLFILEKSPPLDSPTLLGTDPSWWIRYDALFGSNVDSSIRKMIAIRNSERLTING